MSGATPVEMLEAEHRVIQKMVAGMSVLADGLRVENRWMSRFWTGSWCCERLPIAAIMARKRASCSRPGHARARLRTAVQ